MAANDNSNTLTSFSTWLKNNYQKEIVKQFFESTILLNKLRKVTRQTIAGLQWYVFIQTAQNVAVGPYGETDFLHTPNKPTTNNATFARKSNNVRSKISRWLMSASKGDMAAAEALNFQLTDMHDVLNQEVNRQLYGNGSGMYASIKSTSSTTVVKVRTETDASGERGQADLKAGQEVAVLNIDDSTHKGTIKADDAADTGIIRTTITSVDSSNNVTLGDAMALGGTGSDFADNEFGIFPSGGTSTAGKSGFGDAIFGLEAIVSQSDPAHANYGGIARSSNDFWKAQQVVDAGVPSRPLSLALLWELYNKLRKQGARTNLIISDYEQWTNYGLLMNPSRRMDMGVRKLDSGFEALSFNNIDWVPDKDCPPNRIYMLDTSTMSLFQEDPPGFIDEDGSILVRVGSGGTAEDALEMTLVDRREFVCTAPFRNGILDDLTTAL